MRTDDEPRETHVRARGRRSLQLCLTLVLPAIVLEPPQHWAQLRFSIGDPILLVLCSAGMDRPWRPEFIE